MPNILSTDVVIFGGGIAGLWLLNRLKKQGYHAVLFENAELGGEQSIRSQGIIHGGLKYALNGVLTQASNAIADMPDRWRSCLRGEGELDLSSAHILSENHYLWSDGKLGSGLTTFFASKAMRGRSKALKKEQRPTAFQHTSFKGSVYALNEIVLDVPSVIKALTDSVKDFIYKIDWNQSELIKCEDTDGAIDSVIISGGTVIKAKRYIFTAGKGNADLIQSAGLSKPEMQLRPLHMAMVKHKNLPDVFAHCIGTGSKPRMTITTHPTSDGEKVWYLGGDLAENGIERSRDSQLAFAKQELASLFPWIDWQSAQWDTFFIDRAEPQQNSLLRPDTAYAEQKQNIIIGWPTKLALSPNLADEVLSLLQQDAISPSAKEHSTLDIPHPNIAQPAWNSCFND